MPINLARTFDTDHQKKPEVTGGLFDEAPDATAITQDHVQIGQSKIRRLTGEFWTSGQRQASRLHEISYRACFKPQLPRYFIRRFTEEGDAVYDPFSGRGTSAIEAGLMGRGIVVNDVNPLSRILMEPRLAPPTVRAVEERLTHIEHREKLAANLDLSMFYHPDTESEIVALKRYLAARKDNGEEDSVDRWIRMVATNRLTGHSPGFFSVYTLPPNQAVSITAQRKINADRDQTPPKSSPLCGPGPKPRSRRTPRCASDRPLPSLHQRIYLHAPLRQSRAERL